VHGARLHGRRDPCRPDEVTPHQEEERKALAAASARGAAIGRRARQGRSASSSRLPGSSSGGQVIQPAVPGLIVSLMVGPHRALPRAGQP
jgi:hypothetical protein